MPHLLRTLLLLIPLSIATFFGRINAQNSVSGTLQILQPSDKLSDFATTIGANRLNLDMTLTNVDLGSRNIKLKLYIQRGSTLIAFSNDAYSPNGGTYTLQPSARQVLTSAQLAPYFDLSKLQGIGSGTYNAPLSEGLYVFTFEVIDVTSAGVMGQVMARISSQFWLTLNDPPLLNTPSNGENVTALVTNSPINFSWIPRAASGVTDYEFTLVDLGTNYNDPNLLMQFMALENTASRIYRTTSTTNTLTYTGLTPQRALTVGNVYGWRVKAQGSAYKNGGYSEIFFFRYAGNCTPVTGLAATARSESAIDVRWNPSGLHGSYKVMYRKAEGNDNRWFEQATVTPTLTIGQLEANTRYIIKIGGLCDANLMSVSDTISCRTAGATTVADCGNTSNISIENRTQTQQLLVNDVILAAEMPITVTKVSGQSGRFTGEGWTKLPYMGDTKIKVRFSGITLNMDKKLIEGLIETVYDPNWGNIANVDEIINILEGAISNLMNVPLGDPNFNNLLNNLRNILANIHDEQLKADITNLINQLKDLNDRYNAALNRYNSATTEAARQAALTEMNAINQQRNQLNNNLTNLKNQLASGPRNLTPDEEAVLKAAMLLLRQQYNETVMGQLNSELVIREQNYNQRVNSIRQNSLRNSTNISTYNSNHTGVIYIGTVTDTVNTHLSDTSRLYHAAEKNYNKARLIEVLSKERMPNDDMVLIAAIIKTADNRTFANYVKEEKNLNTPIATQARVVADAIIALAEKIINEKIYKI